VPLPSIAAILVMERVMVMQQRSLQMLADGVGRAFRQRALAPAALYLLLGGAVAGAVWAGRMHWPLLAPGLLVLCAVVLGWMQQVRRRWLGIYLVAALLLLVLQSPWSGLDPAGVERVALAAMALAVAQLLVHTVRVVQLSWALQAQVDAMDDTAILALLPGEAAGAARQWQQGDERRALELQDVVTLTLLYAVLKSPLAQRLWLRRVLLG